MMKPEPQIRLILEAPCPHCTKNISIVLTKRGAKDLLKLVKNNSFLCGTKVFVEMDLVKPGREMHG